MNHCRCVHLNLSKNVCRGFVFEFLHLCDFKPVVLTDQFYT